MTAPWLVVVNPQAGNGQLEKKWPELEKRLAKLLPNITVKISAERNNATALIAEAVTGGIRHVMAVGGDGTAHQVINGIAEQQEVPSHEIVFALLPFGTGNDWVKSHGIPKKWEAWRQYFSTGKLRYQNLGKIEYQAEGKANRRYFMNVAGLAYDAFVVQYASQKQSRLPGKIFYLWATFRCLFQYEPQHGIITYDEGRAQAAFYTINIGIGRYSGGGMQLVPQAASRGEQFALTYVGKVSRLEVVLNSFRFYRGWITSYNKAHLTHCQKIKIDALKGNELLIEADGEFLGACPAEINLHQDALCFLAPPETKNITL